MLRNRDDLYSASDYQPITDEHFLRRCSAPVEVQEDYYGHYDGFDDIHDAIDFDAMQQFH